MEQLKGNIFDVQGFSVHDGPGCRTLIFLKGCTLKCKWCSNPEGQSSYLIPMYNKEKCILDGSCIKSCPNKAISIFNNELVINRKLCSNCETQICAEKCTTGALRIAGLSITLNELIGKVEHDRQYWGDQGGITLTGGEPLMHHAFATELLKRCYNKYIHTAIETCGDVKWDIYKEAIKYLDWIFLDIKFFDKEKHIAYAGTSNEQILNNARKLAENFKGRLIFRTVIVPGYNTNHKDITELATFLSSLNRPDTEVNILPVHHLSKEKYRMLDLKYYIDNLKIPSNVEMEKIKSIFESYNLKCYIGNNTPF